MVGNESGISTVEYIIILTILVIGTWVAWQALGTGISASLTTPSDLIEALGGGASAGRDLFL